jgi:hypothetical protein
VIIDEDISFTTILSANQIYNVLIFFIIFPFTFGERSLEIPVILNTVVLGGLLISVLATGPKVRGFKPGQGNKKPQHAFLRRGSKNLSASCPSTYKTDIS